MVCGDVQGNESTVRVTNDVGRRDSKFLKQSHEVDSVILNGAVAEVTVSGVGVGVPATVRYSAKVLGERINLRIPCAVIGGNAMNKNHWFAGPLFDVEEGYSVDLEARHRFSHHADEQVRFEQLQRWFWDSTSDLSRLGWQGGFGCR